MFVVLWEYEVKPGNEQRFERVYGPGGDWHSLFQRDAKHAGTQLFRDTARDRVYLTTDYWHSRKCYEEFHAHWSNEYKALDAATDELTLSQRHIASTETEAT